MGMIAKKHIHFIGICGTAMAPLAKAFKDRGWRVTGSDKGIFPPMSDYLKQHEVDFYVGFHPERMGNPDLTVVGNYIGPSNSEYASMKEKHLPFQSYPEVLARYLIKEESIVVAGTYGKTMTAALIAWIWETAGMRPSYMAAGILNNFHDGVRISDSKWSIVEGDEYPSSRWHPVPKFDYYRPKYLLLTGALWDHADVYLSQDEYLHAFKKLIRSVSSGGMIFAAVERPHISALVKIATVPVFTYNRKGEGSADWSVDITNRDENGETLLFSGPDGEKIGPLRCAILGDRNLDHFAGAVGLARSCGIPADKISEAIATFKGVRRRMEIRGIMNGITVLDDFAHSPAKASSALNGARLHFPHARIIAIFEPNVGSRVPSAASSYVGAFDDANMVFIPRLSSTKIVEGDEERMEGMKLSELIHAGKGRVSRLQDVVYEPDDDALVSRINKIAQEGDVVIYLGSHGFRGMIEQTLKAVNAKV